MKAVAALVLLFLCVAAAPVSVELPTSDAQFAPVGGVSSDAINANCLACHSADMVTNQPKLSAAQWTATVTKMRATFKAPIPAEDDAAIIAWLTAWSAAIPENESAR